MAARAEILGIRRYQQVHTVGSARPGGGTEFDGIAELWLDGVTPTGTIEERATAGAELLADERTFIDLEQSPIWMADEHLLHDGPTSGLRFTAALRRHPSLTREQFRRHWKDVHAPLPLAYPDVYGFARYEQLHTPDDAEDFPLAHRRKSPPPFDGISLVWRNEVDPDPTYAAEVRELVGADEDRLFDRATSVMWNSEVRVVVDRPME